MFLNSPIKTECHSVFTAFFAIHQLIVAKSANCNFILVNCFVETKNTSTAFYVVIK